METIIASFADSIISNGTISEAHILVGIFLVTIIALRKSNQAQERDEGDVDDIKADIEDLHRCVKEISSRIDMTNKDIEMIYNRLTEIVAKLESMDSKM